MATYKQPLAIKRDHSEKPALDNFKPTPSMLKWLETAASADTKPTIEAIAKDSGVDRKNWYLWRKNPQFIEWWNNAWKQIQTESIWHLDKIGLERAKKGEFKFWEAMEKKFGGLQTDVGNGNTNNPFSASIFVVDFKEALRNPQVNAVIGQPVEAKRVDATKVAELNPLTEIKTEDNKNYIPRGIGKTSMDEFKPKRKSLKGLPIPEDIFDEEDAWDQRPLKTLKKTPSSFSNKVEKPNLPV